MNRPSVRRLLVAAAATLALSACTTTTPGGTTGGAETSTPAGETTSSAAADAFPVTIEHALGETPIPERPERVATVSWINADIALALGVVPVGMPSEDWGGNENASTPWKDAALAELDAEFGTEAAPATYSEADGIAFEEIAQLAPDVILAAYSGLTAEEYERLSQIAPVVAYPETPFGTSWQDATRMIGTALGLSDRAEELVASTEQTIAEKVAEYPQLEGKTFIYGNLDPSNASVINLFTSRDNRPKFLELIGLEPAPVMTEAAADGESFFIEWSAERADELASDIFVAWVPSEESVSQIESDPLLGQIPAVQDGTLVTSSDDTLTLAISASSPLSLPWALDTVLPDLAEAATIAQEDAGAGQS